MIYPERGGVRPTKRCLDDLGLKFPPYTQPLSELDHPIVKKAQDVPQKMAAGGAERIVVLADRVWFKAKINAFRAAVTRLSAQEIDKLGLPEIIGQWWIGTAGRREDGSIDDFYEAIALEALRQGKGTGAARTDFLLPAYVDRKRLQAEMAALATLAVQSLVCEVIVQSLRHGKPYSAEFGRYRVTAHVRAADGTDAYLLISAEGIRDPKFLAVILSAVPGLDKDDWGVEPGGVLGVEPEPGELIWSTMIPPPVQARLFDMFPDHGG